MNKVITINLNGNAYQLEEAGYEALRAYLEGATRRLEGNPDRDEIIADIEQAIADKCRAALGAYKTVVETKEIRLIIEEMGPVEDATAEAEDGGEPAGGAEAGSAHPGAAATESKAAPSGRRLYRIREGAMIGGVCSGFAAYFNIDVTLVRIAFVLLTMVWGTGILVYLLFMFLLPTAGTTAEKAAAYGVPSTAQEFIRRAREGYYDGMKTFTDKHAHRAWRRRFHQEMRCWRRTFRNEMRENAFRWQQNWGAGCPPYGIGAWFALPFVAALRAGLWLLCISALVSLLATGAVFGVPLPAGVPVWAGVLCLFVFYQFLAWPLKAWRHACFYSTTHGPHPAPPFIWGFDALIGIASLVLLLWVAGHHLPQIHEAIKNIPPVIHQAVEAVKTWWARW